MQFRFAPEATFGRDGPRDRPHVVAISHRYRPKPEHVATRQIAQARRIATPTVAGAEPALEIHPLNVVGRRARRNEAIARRRSLSKSGLDALDAALAAQGGTRSGETTLLGTVAVETTSAGIDALAALDGIQSIMADQPITLIE